MSPGQQVTLGVDIGTSSSKGVLVDAGGEVLATATRQHTVDRPRQGYVEMDGGIWWDEFCSIARELSGLSDFEIGAVGVSGMGPCVLLADAEDQPLRPAILYGVDTRAATQIAALNQRLGRDDVLQRCGSELTSQAAGAKLAWVADNEPQVFARARRLFMPSSWLVRKLTGNYVLDHHSASQCTPMYDARASQWYRPWADPIAGPVELPQLVWADEVVGHVTQPAAERTGLPQGVPVVAGTIDAWAEQVSVGAVHTGDLMLMYGTTTFLVLTVAHPLTEPSLWGTAGVFEGSHCLAGGMSTTGALTAWLRDLTGAGYEQLVSEAEKVPAGARGLLTLPYFAGERTPIMDPDARGVIAGLTLSHGRAELYRSALEATGFGIRQNTDVMAGSGAQIGRVVAVGGGAKGGIWPQIVSSITGLPQVMPTVTIGACYGDAYLAARAIGSADIDAWNPVSSTIEPRAGDSDVYQQLYASYCDLYPATADVVHHLAHLQTTQKEPEQ